MSRGTVVCFVLTFNRPLALQRAVRSVLGQTYGDLLCIVCDDGSSPRPDLSQFSDPRLILVSGPQRSPEDKRRMCTSSWVLNRARGFLRGARWASYLTDLGTYYPDRLERMTEEWERLEQRAQEEPLSLIWGHQVHEGAPDLDPGSSIVPFSSAVLRQDLEQRNFIDLSSALECARAAEGIEWDESPLAWPDPDRRRWLAHAQRGGAAVRVPVLSDVKRTSPLNAGRVLAAGGDPADLARGPRE